MPETELGIFIMVTELPEVQFLRKRKHREMQCLVQDLSSSFNYEQEGLIPGPRSRALSVTSQLPQKQARLADLAGPVWL